MNTPVPPTPPSNALLQALSASSGNTGTVVQSTLAQNSLQLGQTLLGTVLNRPAPGQFIIQTDAGQLTLQTAANLLNGSSVSLQVQNIGARTQLLILPAQAQSRNTVTNASANQPAITSTLTQGSTIAATVTRTATNPATTNAVSTSSSPGSAGVSGNISAVNSVTAPVGSVAGNAVTPQAGSTPTTPVSSATPTPPTPASAQIASTLTAGTTFNVRILSITPSSSTASQASAQASPGTLNGTVTGTGPSGQTLVQTAQGEIALASRSPLPRGTQLTLQMTSAPLAPFEGAEETSLLLTRQWETLRDAIEALRLSDPAAARNLTQQVLPQGGGPITTGVLFFLSAMMTGDLRRWMGEDAMRALQRTGGNLLERLGRDISEMQRMATEPSGQEWRSYLIPILVGSDLQQLKLFIRGEKDQDDEDAAGQERDTRFVIEVEFSKLGPFQFDGLTRGKNIDLMIRTREALAERMRDEIRAIFADTVSALGFTGTLNFQRTLTFELNPTQEVQYRQGGLTV